MRPSDLIQLACHERQADILGLRLILHSDSREVLERFATVYGWFLSYHEPREGEPVVHAYLLSEATPLGKPSLVVGHQLKVFRPGLVSLDTFFHLMETLYRQVPDRILVHAASLEHRGKGLAVVASSNVGKSTLALELVRRGFTYLSDEILCLNRATGQVEPFPRAAGLRAGTRRLFGNWIAEGELHEFQGATETKWLWQPVGSDSAVLPEVSPAVVVVLEPPPAPSPGDQLPCELEVGLSDRGPEIIKALEAIEGIASVEALPGRAVPTYRLGALSPEPLAGPVEEALAARDVAIIGVHHGRSLPPDYTASPQIRRMPTPDALLRLARAVLNASPDGALMKSLGGRLPLLVSELARLLGTAEFHELQLGRLEEMASLIEARLDALL